LGACLCVLTGKSPGVCVFGDGVVCRSVCEFEQGNPPVFASLEMVWNWGLRRKSLRS